MYFIQDNDKLHYTINDLDVFEAMFKHHKTVETLHHTYENIISIKIHPFYDKIVLATGEPGGQIVLPLDMKDSARIINNKDSFILFIDTME